MRSALRSRADPAVPLMVRKKGRDRSRARSKHFTAKTEAGTAPLTVFLRGPFAGVLSTPAAAVLNYADTVRLPVRRISVPRHADQKPAFSFRRSTRWSTASNVNMDCLEQLFGITSEQQSAVRRCGRGLDFSVAELLYVLATRGGGHGDSRRLLVLMARYQQRSRKRARRGHRLRAQ